MKPSIRIILLSVICASIAVLILETNSSSERGGKETEASRHLGNETINRPQTNPDLKSKGKNTATKSLEVELIENAISGDELEVLMTRHEVLEKRLKDLNTTLVELNQLTNNAVSGIGDYLGDKNDQGFDERLNIVRRARSVAAISVIHELLDDHLKELMAGDGPVLRGTIAGTILRFDELANGRSDRKLFSGDPNWDRYETEIRLRAPSATTLLQKYQQDYNLPDSLMQSVMNSEYHKLFTETIIGEQIRQVRNEVARVGSKLRSTGVGSLLQSGQ